MRALAFAFAAAATFAAPASGENPLAHIGGATYGESRITASTVRYWNNCTAGLEVGANTALHDCSRIIGARLSHTRTAAALYYRGRIYRDLGMHARASADFQSAYVAFNAILAADAEDALAIYGRGLSAIGLGHQAEGAADIDRATDIDANIAAALAQRIEF